MPNSEFPRRRLRAVAAVIAASVVALVLVFATDAAALAATKAPAPPRTADPQFWIALAVPVVLFVVVAIRFGTIYLQRRRARAEQAARETDGRRD